ncbi:MAG TPA: hypothetical protein VGJ20_33105 [Xanthobacteraceae bacterium]
MLKPLANPTRRAIVERLCRDDELSAASCRGSAHACERKLAYPCPADRIAIATMASVGQGILKVASETAARRLTASWLPKLDAVSKHYDVTVEALPSTAPAPK